MAHLSHRQRVIALVAAGALVILTLGGLTWFLLAPSDDEPIADPTTSTSTSTSTSPSTTPTTQPGEDTAGLDEPYRDGEGDGCCDEPGLPLPPMGITETTMTWTRADLPLAGRDHWLQEMFEWDGRLIAAGGTWDEATERESTLLFQSTDGATWSAVDVPPFLAEGAHIVPAGDVVVAFVNRWQSGQPEFGVHLSDDLATWVEIDLAPFAGEGETLWLWHAAGYGDSLILAGNREPLYEPPVWEERPIVIKKNGLTLELDNMTYSFLITDDATGDVVLHGSQEQMWDYERDEEGAILYDPITGERVFTIAWEELNDAAEEAYATVIFGGDFVIEFASDGKRLTFDQYTREIVVTDLATGAVVFTGTEDSLWQGRPPTFVDPRTDTVVLRLTWDEWDRAHEEAYPDHLGEDEWPMPEGVVLASADGGASFVEIDIDEIAGEGFQPASIAGGADGFLMVGTLEGPWLYEGEGTFQSGPTVLRSGDGLTWTLVATDLGSDMWIGELFAVDDGFLAVAGTEFGSMILTTDTGSTWTELLTEDDLLLPFGSAWFERAAGSELGLFVTGSRDGWEPAEYEPKPLIVSKQGRTLTIDGPQYTLVDDATGMVLFEFDEEAYWMELGPQPGPDTASPVRWGEGGFAIFDEDGTLLFALSHEEQWQDGESEEPDEWYEPEQLLLRYDGSSWSSVALPDEVGNSSWFSAISAGDDRLILAVNMPTQAGGDWYHQLVVFIGTD